MHASVTANRYHIITYASGTSQTMGRKTTHILDETYCVVTHVSTITSTDESVIPATTCVTAPATQSPLILRTCQYVNTKLLNSIVKN